MYTREYVFNLKDTFVTAKVFNSGGRKYFAGEEFDKEAVSVRRLRQMWETGFIKPVKAEAEVLEEVPTTNNESVPEVPAVEPEQPASELENADEVAIESEVISESEDAVLVGAVDSEGEIVPVVDVVEEKRKPGRPKKG